MACHVHADSFSLYVYCMQRAHPGPLPGEMIEARAVNKIHFLISPGLLQGGSLPAARSKNRYQPLLTGFMALIFAGF